jgi:Tfp pilus assembly protein PilW
MVGVVIGMIAVLVIYQVFANVRGIKRNISAAGDAQQNGSVVVHAAASRLRMPATGWPSPRRISAAAPPPRQ